MFPLNWLRGEGPREEPVEVDTDSADPSFSARPVRMVEAIRLDTTAEQHMELLQAQGATGRDKAKLIRAAISMALPTLVANPHMIDLLQPGVNVDHDILAEALAVPAPSSATPGNGRGSR